MATEQHGGFLSREAGEDLTGKQYHIVKLDSNGKVVLCDAGSDSVIGVLQNEPVNGDTAQVALNNGAGTYKVHCGGTIAVGATVGTNSTGKAISNTTAGHGMVGRALEAGVSGQIIEVMKLPYEI
jgi:streptogramin lyase